MSYKQPHELKLAEMDTALIMEQRGTTRLKLTGVESEGELLFPQPPKGKMEKWEGVRGVLSRVSDGNGGGVKQRSSRIGHGGRCGHGVDRAGQSIAAACQRSSASVPARG